MKTKITKEDLQKDQIQSELQKGFKWTTQHSKLVMIFVAAFVVLGGGMALFNAYSSSKEASFQEQYYTLERAFLDKKKVLVEAKNKPKTDEKDAKTSAAPAVAATGSLDTDYGNTVTDFHKFIVENHKSLSARMGTILLADLYREYNQTEKSLELFKAVESGLKNNELASTLLYSQWGSTLADNKDCNGAIEKWQKVVDQKKLGFAHSEVKLRMALCYESMGQMDKAETLLAEVSKASEKEADFAAAKDAEKYLKLFKAKKNLIGTGS